MHNIMISMLHSSKASKSYGTLCLCFSIYCTMYYQKQPTTRLNSGCLCIALLWFCTFPYSASPLKATSIEPRTQTVFRFTSKTALSDTQPQEELEKLLNISKLEDVNREITLSFNKQLWLISTTLAAIISLAILVVLLLQYFKSRNTKIQILELESDLKSKDLELLQIRNTQTSNSIESTQQIQQEIYSIIEKLRGSELAKNPVVMRIRQDLERLVDVSLVSPINETPIDSDLLLFSRLIVLYPELQEANPTSQQILLLSINNFSPMEISVKLSRNVQYVRNVRSKLKMMVNPNGNPKWKWTDLQLV